MMWWNKIFIVLFAAYLLAWSVQSYIKHGIKGAVLYVWIPTILGALVGWLIVNPSWRLSFRLHVIGGIKFFRCWMFHGKRRERTGNWLAEGQSICYEIRCAKCGIIDHEWVTPFNND